MITFRAGKTDPKVAYLRTVRGLAAARRRELTVLSSLFDEVQVDPGEVLIREGSPGQELILIVDGKAAVSLRNEPLATVGPGEFVGEMALLERAPHSATVTTLTPVRALVAGSRSFATLLNDPLVLRDLAATLAGRLRAAQDSPGGRRAAQSASTSRGMRR